MRDENCVSGVLLLEAVRKHGEKCSLKKNEEKKVYLDFACMVYLPMEAFCSVFLLGKPILLKLKLKHFLGTNKFNTFSLGGYISFNQMSLKYFNIFAEHFI